MPTLAFESFATLALATIRRIESFARIRGLAIHTLGSPLGILKIRLALLSLEIRLVPALAKSLAQAFPSILTALITIRRAILGVMSITPTR